MYTYILKDCDANKDHMSRGVEGYILCKKPLTHKLMIKSPEKIKKLEDSNLVNSIEYTSDKDLQEKIDTIILKKVKKSKTVSGGEKPC
jgi:hypothetical protein